MSHDYRCPYCDWIGDNSRSTDFGTAMTSIRTDGSIELICPECETDLETVR